MEKSVLFIGKNHNTYRAQLNSSRISTLGSSELGSALNLIRSTESIKEKIRLVFLELNDPYPYGFFDNNVRKNLPNAGFLFFGIDKTQILEILKSLHSRKIPEEIYGARTSVTPWIIKETIDWSFEFQSHGEAKFAMNDVWNLNP